SWFIWNSHSKSEITRRPFTITLASHLRAKSTTSSEKTSTSTLGRSERASRRNPTRSSSEKSGFLWRGSPTTPITSRSKIAAARERRVVAQVVRRVGEGQVVRLALARQRGEDVSPRDTSVEAELLEVALDRPARLGVGLHEVDAGGAAGERLEPHRARSRVKV